MKYISRVAMMLGVIGAVAMAAPTTVRAQEDAVTIEITDEAVAAASSVEETTEDTSTMVKKYTSTTNVSNLGYWVYRPTESTDEELPLIVYMHGISERGSNLDKLITVSLPMYLYNKDVSVNAVVIAPQCPKNTNWTNLADDVMELIQTVIEEENIDEDSISLTGHSLGGIGTWKIALKYPDFFASLVPVSSTINTPQACTALKDVAIWAFHGSKDTMTPTTMLQAYQAIQDAGGTNMQVTMFEGQGHCITGLVYDNPEYDILNWMASQKRASAVEDETEDTTEVETETVIE